jgi:hypothetical protein
MSDAEIARGFNGAAQRFDAGAMAESPRPTARTRPPAIAVHDDGDVLGRARGWNGFGGNAHWKRPAG